MLNAERFKEEILKNSNVVFDFSMSKDKHTIKKCLGTCDDCFFHEVGDHCSNIKVKWLLSEYKEPVKLTRFEHDVLKHLLEKTQYRFIVREKSDSIYIYKRKPNKLKCNFVEVFKVFKHQEAEEEKEHMRNNFSVINLERVRFELKKHAKESYPYRIAFYTKKSPTTLVFDEYFLSLELAEQRMEYLKNFKGKKDNGDFWYDGVNYEADRVIIATRTRNNRNMIISLDDISTKKTDYDEYLELARFIQSEFIR